MRREVGRPRKLELIEYDEVIKAVSDHYQGKITPAKGTIYNKVSALIKKGEIKRYGTTNHALFDKREITEKLCS
jgi:hypothetical protein